MARPQPALQGTGNRCSKSTLTTVLESIEAQDLEQEMGRRLNGSAKADLSVASGRISQGRGYELSFFPCLGSAPYIRRGTRRRYQVPPASDVRMQ